MEDPSRIMAGVMLWRSPYYPVSFLQVPSLRGLADGAIAEKVSRLILSHDVFDERALELSLAITGTEERADFPLSLELKSEN